MDITRLKITPKAIKIEGSYWVLAFDIDFEEFLSDYLVTPIEIARKVSETMENKEVYPYPQGAIGDSESHQFATHDEALFEYEKDSPMSRDDMHDGTKHKFRLKFVISDRRDENVDDLIDEISAAIREAVSRLIHDWKSGLKGYGVKEYEV